MDKYKYYSWFVRYIDKEGHKIKVQGPTCKTLATAKEQRNKYVESNVYTKSGTLIETRITAKFYKKELTWCKE